SVHLSSAVRSHTVSLLALRLSPRPTLFPYTTLFRSGLIRVRNIRALNGRFNTSITHAYSIVIGSKHITLNATDNNTVGMGDAGIDRKSGSAGMPRPISYAVFCLKKKNNTLTTEKAEFTGI